MHLIKKITTLILISLLYSCGGGSSTVTEANTSNAKYIGPGSVWNVSLDKSENTFSITRQNDINSAIDNTITGSFTTEANGFIKMTVGASTTGTPAVGSITYAVDIPDYAFVLKMEGVDIPLVMVPSGNCPSADFDSNALMVNNTDGEDATNAAGNFYHTIHLNKATNAITFPKSYDLVNHNLQANEGDSVDVSSCENGVVKLNGGTDGVLFFTNSDGYIAQLIEGGKEEIIYGLSQKSITAKSNFNGDYYGFRYDATNTAKVEAVEFSCVNGVCDGKKLTDGANTISVNLSNNVDTPATGFINGTISIGGNSGSIACAVDISVNNTTTKILSCIAQSPNDNTELYSLILSSK
jgi:hypothetical protein